VGDLLAFFRTIAIKNQLLLLLLGTMIGIFLLDAVFFNQISRIIYNKNSDYKAEIMTNVESNMIDQIDLINRVSNAISYSDAVQSYLVEEDRLRQYKLFGETTAYLEKMKSIKQGIIDFVLIGTNGSRFNLNYDAQTEATYRMIIEDLLKTGGTGSNASRIGLRSMAHEGTVGKYVVSVAQIRGIQPGTHYGDVIGFFFMLLDPASISSRVEELSQKTTGYFYILDSNNVILASNEVGSIGLKKADLDKKGYIATAKQIPEISFTLLSYLPKDELFKGIDVVRTNSLFLLGLLMAILFMLYLVIARNLVRPLGQLLSFINTMKVKHETMLTERVNLEGYAEINILASKFNQMLDEIALLTTELVDSNSRIYELQLLRKQAEIAFLNSQINPHFLYNTLECIQGIAAARNVEEINRMTAALSRIFRYSIKEKETVEVREELQIVRHYLEIQQIRFEDRFEVELDIDDSLLHLKLKKMLVQPIVENAIFHGLELKLEKGHLWIRVMEQDGNLLIIVQDDGAGIEANKLAELQRLLARAEDGQGTEASKGGIGILNVNRRLKGAYGEPYGLFIESQENLGTKVTLQLPGRGNSDVFRDAG
jgi:Predicted signal transduction protein with a C-terminal ATPase domain